MSEPMGTPIQAAGMPPGGGPPGGYGPPGGGGYGPPGGGGHGGPPGGGGYGGPPGGGGYGGPPGGAPPGGFGGPPGGGGYGGPPGGGGYGGPPGGGGFGGPPMGGPMGPPPGPPQKKSSLPLILGIGCGGLLLLGVIGFVVFAFFIKKAADEAVAEIESSTSAGATGGGVTSPVGAAGTGELKAELRDLRDYKADFGKGRNFISEVHNTGTDTIGLMTVKLTVFDASNTALDSASCYNPMRSLEPGDKFPCQFRLTKVSSWASYKTEIESMKNFLKAEPATLEISEAKLKPKRGYDPITVDGKIKNNSAFKAKSVMVIVSLYDAGGKIVGSDTALVAGNDIDAGAGATFSAKVWSVAATPETFRVRAVGYKQ